MDQRPGKPVVVRTGTILPIQTQRDAPVAGAAHFTQSLLDAMILMIDNPRERRPPKRIANRDGGKVVPIHIEVVTAARQWREEESLNTTGFENVVQAST